MTEPQALGPSTPRAPAGTPPARVIARALRDNALLAFPPQAFEDDVVFRSFFGRRQIILNRPEGIHHILVEKPENYRRTPATIRMLRPLLGNGLLLSQGEDWKHQRRTVAPAFAPRTMPLLARHVARAAEAAVARLRASEGEEVDLLTAMQSLALEIAGASMFSLAMGRYRHELRDLMTGYSAGLGRPTLLDFLLRPDRSRQRAAPASWCCAPRIRPRDPPPGRGAAGAGGTQDRLTAAYADQAA